jgi:hypothetical protein
MGKGVVLCSCVWGFDRAMGRHRKKVSLRLVSDIQSGGSLSLYTMRRKSACITLTNQVMAHLVVRISGLKRHPSKAIVDSRIDVNDLRGCQVSGWHTSAAEQRVLVVA